MTLQRIDRAFLTLPGRQVHYRRAGSGPPVVVLHQSPKSSEELIPLIMVLAAHFTVLAPDTPGYGLSDPIAAPDSEPEIDAFAEAIAEFIDAMGLDRPGLFGLHTGAAIATRFAARYPEKISVLIANGTLIKTPEERADMLAHYLPRFVPSWDGAHLAWAWARMREQVIFFPWYKRDPAARYIYPITLDGLQTNVLALLQAGDNYRTAYRTAFSYAAEEDMPRIAAPARFVCAETDPLYRYLERFPPLPPTAAIVRVATASAVTQSVLDIFREWVPAGASPPAIPTRPQPRRLNSMMVDSPGGGRVHLRVNVDGRGRPIVVLHEAGGSARGLDELLGGFIGARPIYAPDLPGHGESDPPICDGPLIDGPLIEGLAAQLDRAVDAIGLSDLDLVALGEGAAVALAWAALNPGRIVSVTLCNPAVVPAARIESFAQGLAPALTPDWAGGHLLTAWHAARDRDMFWPWFDKSPAAALPLGIPASDAIVQQRVIDLFKAEATHAPLAAALTRAPLLDMLRRCSAPLRLFASTEQPVFPDLTALCAIAALPARPLNWAPVILGALDTDRTTP